MDNDKQQNISQETPAKPKMTMEYYLRQEQELKEQANKSEASIAYAAGAAYGFLLGAIVGWVACYFR